MGQRVRQGIAVVAVAVVLAYTGTVSVSPVRDFAPWRPTNLSWLSVVSAICGVLLALSSDRAAWSIVAASVLAVLIFGGLWSYICWALLGQYISFFDLIQSDLVLFYVIQLGILMFMASALFGLLGAVIATVFLPDRYRP